MSLLKRTRTCTLMVDVKETKKAARQLIAKSKQIKLELEVNKKVIKKIMKHKKTMNNVNILFIEIKGFYKTYTEHVCILFNVK